MAVMMPREKWTDEKLDDLQTEMRAGFARVEGDVKRLDGDIKRLDENVKRLDSDVKRLDGKLSQLGNELHARFEALNRTLIGGLFAVVVAIIGSNAALIASSAF